MITSVQIVLKLVTTYNNCYGRTYLIGTLVIITFLYSYIYFNTQLSQDRGSQPGNHAAPVGVQLALCMGALRVARVMLVHGSRVRTENMMSESRCALNTGA